MPPYTIKNLMDVDNSAAARTSNMEMRLGRSHIESEHLGVTHVRYAPGFRATLGHHHVEQEEAYVVVSGAGRVKLDDEVVEIKQWDVVRVSPPVVRAFAAGPEGMELIAIGSDRPADGDGVLVKDWWTE